MRLQVLQQRWRLLELQLLRLWKLRWPWLWPLRLLELQLLRLLKLLRLLELQLLRVLLWPWLRSCGGPLWRRLCWRWFRLRSWRRLCWGCFRLSRGQHLRRNAEVSLWYRPAAHAPAWSLWLLDRLPLQRLQLLRFDRIQAALHPCNLRFVGLLLGAHCGRLSECDDEQSLELKVTRQDLSGAGAPMPEKPPWTPFRTPRSP